MLSNTELLVIIRAAKTDKSVICQKLADKARAELYSRQCGHDRKEL